MKKLIAALLLCLACSFAPNTLPAEEGIDESELFSSPEMISAPASVVYEEDRKTIGFSGEITSALAGVVSSTSNANSLYSYTVANIFLDIRMKQGLKAFANLETTYFSNTKNTEVALRELFFDFNFNRKIYLRTGKQVLQWGRCYLWNPTDLINIEKKTFIRKIGYREGAYGMKMHMPFGTKYNIYGFLDTGNTSAAEDAGGALKYEFLLGNTEMAFSGWGKNNYNPVFGYDFSSRLAGIDIAGELSVSRKDNVRKMVENQGLLDIKTGTEEWSKKASVDFSKSFRLGEFNDRFSVTSEFFYNQAGYEGDIFSDKASYAFASPVLTLDAAGMPALKTTGTKSEFITFNSLYEIHNFSRYYGAVFTTISRFVITDMTLNINYIRNLCDSSGIISSGVTYKNLNDFSAGLLISANTGPGNSEYTHTDEKFGLQLTLGIAF